MIREALDNVHRTVIYTYLTSGTAKFDREIAHERALKLLGIIENSPSPLRAALAKYFTYQDPILETQVFGLMFKNPLGIAGGFDKNGLVPNALGALGFSHVEIGTITPTPQKGRDRPRIFDLPEDQGYINRMGFPSVGMKAARSNIAKRHVKDSVLGINIGPNAKSVEEDRALDDYIDAAKYFKNEGDYLSINVSSPNTTRLRELQGKEAITAIVDGVKGASQEYFRKKAVLIKIAPDLSFAEIDDILDVVLGKVDGIIATNTTVNPKTRNSLRSTHKNELGGISGRPLTQMATQLSHYIFEHTEGRLPIVRAGGVMDSGDYFTALTFGGASLVQVYTAFVEKRTSTPNFAYYLNKDLALNLHRWGIKNVREIIGTKMTGFIYPQR